MINQARATTRTDRRLPTVHCFVYGGRKLAYFVRTGDIVALSDAAFQAMRLIEKGTPASEAMDSIECEGFSEDVVNAVMKDLSRLESAGYFTPEITLTETDTAEEIAGLLRHHPRNIMFLVTEACNLACAYCYEKNQGVHDKPATIKQVDARRVIDRYIETTIPRKDIAITFFGGEPLLNFSVVRDVVAYAEDRSRALGITIVFTITTNATLITADIADFLAQHRFHVMVSLDGEKEANDRYRVFRDGTGTHDTVVRNLRLLIETMHKSGARLPKIRATATAENFDAIGIESYLRSLGTHLVEVGETHGTVPRGKSSYDVGNLGSAAAGGGQRHIQEQHRILEALDANPDSLPNVPAALVKSLRRIHEEATREEVKQRPAPTLCGVCRNMKAVTPGGDLYPCHRYVGMPAFKLGNIHTGGVDETRAAEYYRQIYTAYADKCTQCWARYICGGQCPWYLSANDGTLAPPDDEGCDLLRTGFESALGFYALLLERHPRAFQRILNANPSDVLGSAPNQAPDISCGA